MSDHLPVADLLSRVTLLERRVRRLSGTLTLLLLFGMAAVIMGWTAAPKTTDEGARRFTVLDANGAPVAQLSTPPGRNGTGLLHLGRFDEEHPDTRGAMTLQGGVLGAQLLLNNRSGRIAMQLGEDVRTRSGVLQIYDGQENLRIALGLRVDGSPMLLFLDEQGKVTSRFPESL